MLDDERESIIEKALKIREYANRGVGGEKTNAIRMLAEYKEKHNITDDEMNLIKSYGNSWYDSVPKEERGTPFNKWFRRSVTTYIDKDDKDKIMVFYHKSRTQIPFNEFDHDKGIKFSDKNNYGFHFLFEEDKRYIHHIGHDHNGTGVEFYVYLRMVNPYYLYSRLDGNSYGQQGEQYRPIKIYKLLVEGLIHLGYDSIIIQDELGINVYIVFHPNQIKSINNKGEYSMNNNDIFS